LTSRIYKALQQKDISYLTSISSKYLSEADYKGFETILSATNFANAASDFDIVGEFLIKKTSSANVDQVTGRDFGGHKYTYQFKAYGDNTYVCLFTVTDFYPKVKWLISCVFDKESDEWKLNNLFVGNYSYNNLTAPDLYAKKIQAYDAHSLVYSTLYTQIAMSIMNPAGPRFHYDGETDMQKVFTKILQDAKVALIRPVTTVSTNPEILSIMPEFIQGSFYPLVIYKSVISIDNISTLKKENDDLNAQINTILPGIKQFSDTVIYKVTNDYPVNNQIGRKLWFCKEYVKVD